MSVSLAQKNDTSALDTLRTEAAAVFSSAPAPSFTYGLNVFFPPGSVSIPRALLGESSEGYRNHPQDAPGFTLAGSTYAVNDSGDLPSFPPDGGSSHQVAVMPLSVALADDRFVDIIRARLTPKTGDRIDAWNIASLQDGIFVHVPRGVQASAPVRIDARITESERADCVFVLAEAGSAVTVVEHLASAVTGPALRASRTEIVARDNAVVKHVSVQDFDAEVTAFDRKRAEVGRNASVSWTDCTFSTGYVRSRVETALTEEGASVRLLGLTFAAHGARHDMRHEVAHQASRTVSDIRARAAVGAASKTVYRSMVRIAPGTASCTAAQKEDTLLLDRDAEIDAMPDLEIGTDDVRARHSASAGRVNREHLFYLMSRGMTEAAARKTLIEAFFAPVVADMRDAGLHDMVECLMAATLESYD